MPDFLLIQKLRELCKSDATLLWLEGARHDRVVSLKLLGGKLVLRLADGTSRMIAFERYAVTAVGLQFWSQGHPGVLYRWEQVTRTVWEDASDSLAESELPDDELPPDPPIPPNLAA